MQPIAKNSTAVDLDVAVNDLGPLAWVLDELRKSLDASSKALKRFVRDAEAAVGSDLAALDANPLRIARQQLHQAVGALEMVGLPTPALVLRAMEAAVQKFVQQPEQCTQEAAARIERASFALTEYLVGVLANKPISPVSLFPQYRQVQELVRADRIHPADLWPHEWRWIEPELQSTASPLSHDTAVRALLDQSMLQIMKGSAPRAAADLKDLSLRFSAGQADSHVRIFWKVAAAYFEALAHNLLPADIYVRRAASRILLQYASLSKGDASISDRLTQDLLFFCSQAIAARAADAPVLSAVRSAYGLARFKPVDYEAVQFGRFDPALIAQARKRILSAKEAWSYLSAGDTTKCKVVVDQFGLVSDSLVKLHPSSEPLALALSRTIDATARSGQAPSIGLAMEVATSVLCLEAALDDLDPNDPQLAMRTAHLAERLEGVRNGGEPQPLEAWMEELYRHVSDKQTMGSVVGELRVSLGELEKSLDIFFRNPRDKTVLRDVPGQMSQMRGVLSVLGLEQASQAVLHMRESVEKMLVTEVDEQLARGPGTFEHLGNNLGALSFLIDMLNYQPVLAKKLFIYDDAKGELRPLMGRSQKIGAAASVTVSTSLLSKEVSAVVQDADAGASSQKLTDKLDALATHAALAGQAELAKTAREAAVAVSANNEDVAASAIRALAISVAPVINETAEVLADEVDLQEEDLRDIFLEEAREVATNGQLAIQALAGNRSDVCQLTILRRVFHTLKGSARMVGLNEFGEAAWSVEQLFNSWMADQKPASDELMALSSAVLTGLAAWTEDIAANRAPTWSASAFRISADAMRSEGRFVPLPSPLQLPVISVAEQSAPTAPELEIFDTSELDAAALFAAIPATEPVLSDTEFDTFFNVTSAPFDASSGAIADASAPPVEPVLQDSQSIDFESLGSLPDVSEEGFVPPDLPQTESIGLSNLYMELDANEEENVAAELAGATQPDELTAEDIDAAFILQTEVLEIPVATAAIATATEKDADAERSVTASSAEEQTKVIGTLRIGIPLYNVYLNEADEWSRRLVTEIAEWALEFENPVADSTVALAHSLAGSSATVGFKALSEIARALEQALQKSQTHHSTNAAAGYAPVFVDASEDIRRLLHQFAAGFLKEADVAVLRQLQELEFVDPVSEMPLDAAADIGDSTLFNEPFILEPAEAVAEPVEADTEYVVDTAEMSVPAPVVRKFSAQESQESQESPAITLFSTATASFSGDEEDGLDGVDAVDAVDQELFPIFDEEAAELMPQLGGALRQWSARPENGSARMEVLRALHTLKGSARLAGAMRVGEMAHNIESEIEFLGSQVFAPADFEPLLTRFDAMSHALDALRKLDYGQSTQATALPAPALVPAESVSPAETATALEITGALLTSKAMVPAPQAMVMQPLRQAANASVRVRSQLLDRMVNQAGEVMITRSRLEVELNQLRGSLADMSGNLNRLRQQLRDIELQAESQMQSRLAQAKEAQAGFDPLEFDRFTRVQELTRMMAESVNDVATVQRTLQRTVEATEDDLIAQARQTRELQRDLLRTRMVEFEGISDRLYRVVRQASKETGKQVRLDLLGGTMEMDRGMLDRMTPAFEHLLRNCVVHGVESPEARTAVGKDPIGLITVHLRQEGNDVSVEFSDDGAGLDLERIREKALSLGLLTADQTIDDQEGVSLIFTPGFSTVSEVTELAGRGIGMDVVRSEVNSIGGRIETSTAAGKGTHFKLILPLTTAVTQVVMMRAGDLSVGVPANVVETVRRVTAKELQQAYNTGLFEVAGEAVPFFWSGALLQSSRNSAEAQAKTTPIVVFRSAAQRIALHVDEVLGTQEVVVKNLGPQLSRMPGLAGMSVLASGAVVLIYNPVALASVYGQQARALSSDKAEPHILESTTGEQGNTSMLVPAVAQTPLILVVDDSITVRRVTQRLLQREGYRVVLAADGLQALERLLEERPTVVLSDIEMPRMDGFDLARNIRADARLHDLPIIMITSRIAEKHREHAMELGVNHYLGKPYSEDELMSLVRHYCAIDLVS